MKNIIKNMFCIILLFTILCTHTYANESNIKVLLDNQEISFDVKPQVINERTMVPVRAIFESMGATVDWNQDTQTVNAQKGSTKVIMKLNSNIVLVNGKETIMDVTLAAIDGRTLAPARYVAESFGYNVGWNQETSTVIIESSTKKDKNIEYNLINSRGIVITYKGIENDKVKIYVDNTSNYSFKLSIYDYAINGIRCGQSGLIAQSIAPKSKVNLSFDINKYNILMFGNNKNYESLKLLLWLRYDDYLFNDVWKEYTINIGNPKNIVPITGTPVFSDARISIDLLSQYQNRYTFVLTNKYNEYYDVSIDSLTVNGYSVPDTDYYLQYETVLGNSQWIFTVEIPYDFMLQNNIYDIDNINFKVTGYQNYSKKWNSDLVKLKTK